MFAIISFPHLLHERREAQDEMNGKQGADNIFHRIYYCWPSVIRKTLSLMEFGNGLLSTIVHLLEFANGFLSPRLSSGCVCFLGTFVDSITIVAIH